MRLSVRRLNRTLLRRQHLLQRTPLPVVDLARHLVGLQAQETVAPFLSLAARLEHFDPHEVTRGMEDRSLVRLLAMRGTVHLLAADDVGLRAWTQSVHERTIRSSQNVGRARELDRAAFLDALDAALADGPVPQKDLGAALAAAFPGHQAAEVAHLARSAAPLVQLPPRGTWKGSGSVVYDRADRWTGRPLDPPATEEVVLRYLRSHGPATAADVTAWSAVTRIAPLVKAMAADGRLERHEDEAGRPLYDAPGGELADEDEAAPVRLLGRYDNVWLSHAGRDRVTGRAARAAWSGPNGGAGCTLFADGYLVGLWQLDEAGRVVVVETVRPLTRGEQRELAEETERVESLLSR